MKKTKLFTTITFAFVMMFLLGTSLHAQASPAIGNEKFIEEGYTEDGIKYSVYEVSQNEGGIAPRIAVSKKVSIVVYYDGKVTPPSTYNYNVYDNGYKVKMKGTLYLGYWEYLPVGRRTRAPYSGTIHGNI